jgi:methyltransferase (TIGR00027 family)
MDLSTASRTALATSLMRSLHTRTARLPLIDDDWGDRLVPEAVRASPLAHDDLLRANAAYADVILRTRYNEDALKVALATGICQYLLIGAGFDSQVCRPRPGKLQVYELDHPATQALKRQRLRECRISEPAEHHHFIAADLGEEALADALARSTFQSTEKSFCSWLGVTMYLPREANLACLRSIAACTAPGSELVFTYVDEAVFGSGYAATPAFTRLRERVAARGEPFVSGFDPATLKALLSGCGLELLEDLNGDEMVARFDPEGLNGLQSNPAAHIVHARVR